MLTKTFLGLQFLCMWLFYASNTLFAKPANILLHWVALSCIHLHWVAFTCIGLHSFLDPFPCQILLQRLIVCLYGCLLINSPLLPFNRKLGGIQAQYYFACMFALFFSCCHQPESFARSWYGIKIYPVVWSPRFEIRLYLLILIGIDFKAYAGLCVGLQSKKRSHPIMLNTITPNL